MSLTIVLEDIVELFEQPLGVLEVTAHCRRPTVTFTVVLRVPDSYKHVLVETYRGYLHPFLYVLESLGVDEYKLVIDGKRFIL